ncbi:hypothetical protein ACFLYI_02085 [Chloroflexota bacterium]
MSSGKNNKGMNSFKSLTFTTKNGIRVQTKPHFATFNEKHNASRVKCYLVLYHHKYKLGNKEGLSLGELHRASGVSYSYIKTKIAWWCEWGFCDRKVALGNGKPVFRYSLGERGKHFLESVVPSEWLQYYIAEIRAFRANNAEEY